MPHTSHPPSSEVRDRAVRLRISEREYKELQAEAVSAGLPLAAILRGLIQEGRRVHPARNPDYYAERARASDPLFSIGSRR